MKRYQLLLAGLLGLTVSVFPVVAQLQRETTDAAAMAQIREEGLQHSRVMETASYLTDVFGPRLTNSPNIRSAAQWTTRKLTEWGLSNVNLEAIRTKHRCFFLLIKSYKSNFLVFLIRL